ncbi:BLUF domain-containing protein [Robiginitalea sp. M366]|uniref:BLUF domain-containing protein n=1 Tax=Robiginitalea aestuariiviva TaxID=3036903 RepID=UPI00240E4CDE|nr:BLUF domain-containing protein [Robiginitalea aestuariiviva]MDG1571945.1 BLUF domain-containing protein [Robiginitalea aestuariiviva]
MGLRRIIYSSQASGELSKRQLLDLLHESRAYNALDGITGVLLHRQGHFLQVIEGESEPVDNLYARILRDTRHQKVSLILDEEVSNRLFSDWAMGCADFDDPELEFMPGIRSDLADPEVIQNLMSNLPEMAAHLQEILD